MYLGDRPAIHCKKTTSHPAHKSGNIPRALTHSAWTVSTATERFLPQNVAAESFHAE